MAGTVRFISCFAVPHRSISLYQTAAPFHSGACPASGYCCQVLFLFVVSVVVWGQKGG